MNADFKKINAKIEKYNAAQDEHTKLHSLQELDQLQRKLDDKYTDDQITCMPDYQKAIQETLFLAMKQQREYLGVMPVDELALPELISNMDPDVISRLFTVLTKGETTQLGGFFKDHDISFIGGDNSKNFKVKSKITGITYVLKAENRLNEPKDVEGELREQLSDALPQDNFLINKLADRRVTYVNSHGVKTTGTISVTDYATGQVLSEMAAQPSDPTLKRDIEAQQLLCIDLCLAQLLSDKRMNLLNKTNTDRNGTNNFYERDPVSGKIIVKIADCKAFYRCDDNGMLIMRPKNKLPIFCLYISAPEVCVIGKPRSISVDKMNVYIAGKNLYQSLVLFHKPFDEERDHKTIELSSGDFDYPIFHQALGPDLILLMQDMIKKDPEARISTHDAIQRLIRLKHQFGHGIRAATVRKRKI